MWLVLGWLLIEAIDRSSKWVIVLRTLNLWSLLRRLIVNQASPSVLRVHRLKASENSAGKRQARSIARIADTVVVQSSKQRPRKQPPVIGC